jgi:hypothetical protein
MKQHRSQKSAKKGIFPCVIVAALFLLFGAGRAYADFAVTQQGLGLFNVIVEDTETTWSRPLKVLIRPESFVYNYDTKVVSPLPGHHAEFYWIGDYVTTQTVVGKATANALMKQYGWSQYEPPPPARIVVPTPAPVTPVPEATIAVHPGDLADPSLPMDERVSKQLQIFIRDQTELGNQINLAEQFQNYDRKKGKEQRLQLLDRQIRILRENYDQSINSVQKAMQALLTQREEVEKKGTFTTELFH